MSEGHFHVHGPHDHQLEHAAEHGAGDKFAGRIAALTAILATIGALMSYEGGSTQAEAGTLKNDAAIAKTAANDQWAYYQAKGTKQNLAELGEQLAATPEKVAKFREDAERYGKEKTAIQEQAKAKDEESERLNQASEAMNHVHHRWALATTFLQISIALSAIALLTRRTWLVYGVYGVAAIGLIIGGTAALHL